MTGEETDLKIQAWIAMVKLEIVLRQRKEGFICETSHLDEFVVRTHYTLLEYNR